MSGIVGCLVYLKKDGTEGRVLECAPSSQASYYMLLVSVGGELQTWKPSECTLNRPMSEPFR